MLALFSILLQKLIVAVPEVADRLNLNKLMSPISNIRRTFIIPNSYLILMNWIVSFSALLSILLQKLIVAVPEVADRLNLNKLMSPISNIRRTFIIPNSYLILMNWIVSFSALLSILLQKLIVAVPEVADRLNLNKLMSPISNIRRTFIIPNSYLILMNWIVSFSTLFSILLQKLIVAVPEVADRLNLNKLTNIRRTSIIPNSYLILMNWIVSFSTLFSYESFQKIHDFHYFKSGRGTISTFWLVYLFFGKRS